MPSTVVHVAVALLVAAGLLGSAYDRRALVVVGVAALVPDLDVFASLLVESTHRAALHTLFVPLGATAAVYYDTRLRDGSWLRDRYGTWGVQVAWASVAGLAFGGIGLDLFTAQGVNVFYPLYDQFVSLDGKAGYSSTQGVFQTFVEVSDGGSGGGGGGGAPSVDVGQRGSTDEVHVGSGVDPSKGPEPEGVKRVFPVAYRGWHLTLLVASLLVTWVRLRRTEGAPGPSDGE
ncbi:metal-dependent hydrolase [Halorarius halobius]|uniref:metal-dependent hydrolase n=1 Tax=Halorarius halobius TaxID=2962671 RepID=UPI0020CB6F79|nr:metal-dependent hydrolase [Halorarius halobius]